MAIGWFIRRKQDDLLCGKTGVINERRGERLRVRSRAFEPADPRILVFIYADYQRVPFGPGRQLFCYFCRWFRYDQVARPLLGEQRQDRRQAETNQQRATEFSHFWTALK